MTIVHCFFSFKVGGAEVLATEMMNELADSHRVALIILNNEYDEALVGQLSPSVERYFLHRAKGSRNPLPVLQFNLLLIRLNPDVIHSHDDLLINITWIYRSKSVYTIHDTKLANKAIKNYKALVSVSKTVQAEVQQRSGLQCSVIYNGIRADRFAKRTSYFFDGNETFRIVQVARLVHYKKGQDILLHALQYLRQQSGQKIEVDFIGEGPSHLFLERLATTLGVQDVVCFIGVKSRKWLQENLSTYHLLVQPSRNEGFGLTIVEAVAASIPVLVPDTEGPCEVISEDSLIFETGDSISCAFKIQHLIQRYRQNKIQELLNTIYPPILQQFTLQHTVREYESVYKAMQI